MTSELGTKVIWLLSGFLSVDVHLGISHYVEAQTTLGGTCIGIVANTQLRSWPQPPSAARDMNE